MSPNTKQTIAWMLIVPGVIGVGVSYYAIWVLVAYWGAGLVGFASLAVLISGPVSAAGGCVASRQPRQKAALALGVVGFLLWLTLWVLIFAVLGFRIGG